MMSRHFTTSLAKLNPAIGKGGAWVLILPDQLSLDIGPHSRMQPGDGALLLIESHCWWDRRPSHRQKIATVIANMRNFALEAADRGFHVDYRITEEFLGVEVANWLARGKGSLMVMNPAEREMAVELLPHFRSGRLKRVLHEGWLTTKEDFEQGAGEAPWRMDSFYRHVRQRYNILMEKKKPLGGRYSFDGENRESWKGSPPAPNPPVFPRDVIKQEVADLIAERFPNHPGCIDMDALPATHADAVALWDWAKAECMESFGPYEDAMTSKSSGLFHTRLSTILNLHRLTPRQVLDDVLSLDIPLNSKEGFVRQLIGWREYVRHVHEATDGFRNLPPIGKQPVRESPGDGGYTRWAGRNWEPGAQPDGIDGGSDVNHLHMETPLPPAYWGAKSGLNCLDSVVGDVWREAWSHHITRLMVLSNLATLMDVSPRELTDWFWVAYSDAWDWVVEPNVLGMGTFGTGELMTTKPYVAGAAYINKMSDYCGDCQFSPNGNCPIRRLYWAFLDRHEDQLRRNPRMFQVMNSLGKRAESERRIDREVYVRTRDTLLAGKELRPD